MDRVSQDPEALQRIVGVMGEKMERYQELCNEVLRMIDEKIGGEYTGSRAWWGNNAKNYSARVNENLTNAFNATRTTVEDLKDNLNKQIEAWRQFEGM